RLAVFQTIGWSRSPPARRSQVSAVVHRIGGLRLTGVSALYVESRQSTYHSKQFSVAARENQRHNMSTRCLLPAVFIFPLHQFYLMEPLREAGFISSKNDDELCSYLIRSSCH